MRAEQFERIVASGGWQTETVRVKVRPRARAAWGLLVGTFLIVALSALLRLFPLENIGDSVLVWMVAGLLGVQLVVAAILSLMETPVVREDEILKPLEEDQRPPRSPYTLY